MDIVVNQLVFSLHSRNFLSTRQLSTNYFYSFCPRAWHSELNIILQGRVIIQLRQDMNNKMS